MHVYSWTKFTLYLPDTIEQMNKRLAEQLDNLPTDPGIYKYFDADNELIYVGKAVNLKNRVKSYFTGHDHSPKTQVLVSRIDRLETITVQSEMDALILEANLIKEFRPRYNIILKDDKSHLYIKITLYEDLPRVSTCRQTDIDLDPKATYFGPYPSGGTVKQTLRYFRRIFPYVARHQPPVTGRRRPPQSYFYYNLPLGPVDTTIDKKLYRKQIFELVHFLEGKRLQVAAELEKDMKSAAKAMDFEQAAAIKKQLDALNYVSQRSIRPESYMANPELMADKREQGLRELAEALGPYWPELVGNRWKGQGKLEKRVIIDDNESSSTALRRIECYDISNISGQQAVGSMVVFEDGEAKKSDYRKFRIKRENTPNDFAMLQEVLRRRFSRLKERPASSVQLQEDESASENSQHHKPTKPPKAAKVDTSFATMPDLIIVDGGKGQLSAATAVLQELELDIPIVGMTKREEELVLNKAARLQGGEAASGGDREGVLNSEVRVLEEDENSGQDGGAIAVDGLEPITYNLKPASKPNRSSAHASFARSEEEAATQTSTENNFTTIRLARGSEALFLIQRLRDEAHRFAITYHRKLRGKAFLPK